jgi:hypothetical protein
MCILTEKMLNYLLKYHNVYKISFYTVSNGLMKEVEIVKSNNGNYENQYWELFLIWGKQEKLKSAMVEMKLTIEVNNKINFFNGYEK